MQLVPPEKRGLKVPCRYIRLNERGDTIESLYRSGTQDELESALRAWLTREIKNLENAQGTDDQQSARIETEASTLFLDQRNVR